MGSAPPGHWKSLCITHLATCPNQNSPTDSADEAEFVYESGSGIQDVVVTALRLASRVTTGDRLTLEADTVGHPTAVYDLLARLGPAVPSTSTASPRSSWRRQ